MKKILKMLVGGILLFIFVTPLAAANQGFHKSDADLYESNNVALGIGFGIVRFDTNVKGHTLLDGGHLAGGRLNWHE